VNRLIHSAINHGIEVTMSGEDNPQRIKTLDDAWNAQGLRQPGTLSSWSSAPSHAGRMIVEEKLFYDQVSFLRQIGVL
jgi:hypothetical protein